MQYFYLRQNSVLPQLRIELIDDGRHTFNKFHDMIQNAEITFTMVNADTNVTKIAKAPCYIKRKESEGCVEEYVICYDWKKRDTKEVGTFKGFFEITFGDIKSDDVTYPKGNLWMPIREDLMITILPIGNVS
nr:MAG TPA: hypothetical protein [Bacteriophage sp.]